LSTAEIKSVKVGIVSGIPEQHLRRRVIIYSPGRTATQQGSGKLGKWKINFVSTQKWEKLGFILKARKRLKVSLRNMAGSMWLRVYGMEFRMNVIESAQSVDEFTPIRTLGHGDMGTVVKDTCWLARWPDEFNVFLYRLTFRNNQS
jgi:hypothetical protein